MSLFECWRKRAYLALFLFLASCQKNTPWHLEKSLTGNECYNSARLTLVQDCASSREFELEFDIAPAGLTLYVNLTGRPLQSCAEVIIRNSHESHSFNAFLLFGGQRILLSESACDYILNALLHQDEIRISIGPYESAVPSGNFFESYLKFVENQVP